MTTFANTAAAVNFLVSNNLWNTFFVETPTEMNGFDLQAWTNGEATAVKVIENGKFFTGMVSYNGSEVNFASEKENEFRNALPTSLNANYVCL